MVLFFCSETSFAQLYVSAKIGRDNLTDKNAPYFYNSTSFGIDFNNYQAGSDVNSRYGIEFSLFQPKFDVVYTEYPYWSEFYSDDEFGYTTYGDYSLTKFYYGQSYSIALPFVEGLYISPLYIVGLTLSYYGYASGGPEGGFQEEGMNGHLLFSPGVSLDKVLNEKHLLRLEPRINFSLTPFADRFTEFWNPNKSHLRSSFSIFLSYGYNF